MVVLSRNFATALRGSCVNWRKLKVKRAIVATLLAVACITSTGCFIPAFSGDPSERTKELLVVSENARALRSDWQRFWHLDQVDHQKPRRTSGAIF